MSKKYEYLKIDQAAEHLNVGPKVIRKLIRENVIPTVHLGYRTLRIPSDGLEAALADITTHPGKLERRNGK